MLVLVTGATGFLGRALISRLAEDSTLRVRASSRSGAPTTIASIESVCVADLTETTDWKYALSGVEVVVHTAARVHVMRDDAIDPVAEFRRVNVTGTLNLARQAAGAGVRRFVFISSIKVNGEQTTPGSPFTSGDTPGPIEPYGVSKHEAEQALRRLAQDTSMEVVIIRPVLVYGPGVKANFLAMMRWLQQGIPLPFGSIHNRRSLVAVGNLTDLIARCLDHPAAANQTLLISDGDDVSTATLLRRAATAMDTQARLIPVPPYLLRAAMRLMGKADVAQRLCASLQVDIEPTRQLLGWTPPVSMDAALRETANWFLRRDSSLHGGVSLDRD